MQSVATIAVPEVPCAEPATVSRGCQGQALFAVVSVLLLVGSVYRAAHYPLVHDECLSFASFTFEPQWAQTANHHLLNTWAMEWCARWLGVSEFALRLPNVLAHGVYLGCVLVLLRRLEPAAVKCCAFVGLNLNPFVLDYFALARGYGLGLAALALSLVLLARSCDTIEDALRRRALLGALAAGGVAVLANFSFFFFYAALHVAAGMVIWRKVAPGARWRLDAAAVAAVLLSVGITAVVIVRVEALRRQQELYFGGSEGFFRDTVRSLVESSLYRGDYPDALRFAAPLVFAGLFLPVVGAGIWGVLRGRRSIVMEVFGTLLAMTVVLPMVGRAGGATLFPIERAALGYVPLAVAVWAFALSEILRRRERRWLSAGTWAFAALGAAHFAASYDPFHCRTWSAEAHNKTVLEMIVRDRRVQGDAAPVNLATHWVFRPSLVFYRLNACRSWLATVGDFRVRRGDEAYAYVFEKDAGAFADEGFREVARFADTRTVLLARR